MNNKRAAKIKLPFGLCDNKIMHIGDVERGLKCNCICPSCQSPLVAAKGAINQLHFKHSVENECEGGMESAVHLAAKQMVMERKQITFQPYATEVIKKDSRGFSHSESGSFGDGKIVDFDSVEDEKDLCGMVADLLATKTNKPLIIEIFYRHKVDDQKLAKILEANISAIEIDLSDLKPEDVKDWDAFWSCINEPSRFKWLHNTKAPAYSLELQKRLDFKIEEREKIYRVEREKADKEKDQLKRALNHMKAISSPDHVARLKVEAEAHLAWKRYKHIFSDAFQNAPAFTDVDVPNGDWIFGCDRRVWQIAFYCSFIRNNDKPFSIRRFDQWLQERFAIKPILSVKIVNVYGKKYPDLLPSDLSRVSSWATLRAYFNYLSGLGMLEYSGGDRQHPGNVWFRVVSKTPRFATMEKAKLRSEGALLSV